MNTICSNGKTQGQQEDSFFCFLPELKAVGTLTFPLISQQSRCLNLQEKGRPGSASQFLFAVGWKVERQGLKRELMALFAHLCEKPPRTLVAHSGHLLLSLDGAVNWNSIAMLWEPVEVRRPSETLFKLTLIQTGNWPLAPGRNSTPVEISLSLFQLS